MVELLHTLSDYAALGIFTAAILDIFFLTGYLLYGATTTATILMLYNNSILSAPEIAWFAFLGTLTGNMLNFFIGRHLGTTKIVAKTLQSTAAEKARAFLRTRGLFLFVLFGRFITLTRPIYALINGALHISFKQFIIYEVPIAFAWVAVWLWIMITGFDAIMWLKDQIMYM